MHRTDPPASVARSSSSAKHAAFQLQSTLFACPSHDTSRSTFAPLHYEAKYAYPLLVWLHGPESDERELMRVMPLVSMRNYVAVAPRGFHSMEPDQEPTVLDWPQLPDYIQAAEQRVFDALEAARQRFTLHPQRVFIAGFDAGGTMAFRMAMNHPRQFAGVLSIGGAFPRTLHPFRQLTDARRLPVFLAVGRDSEGYSPTEACEDLRLFHSAGMSVTLRQYPNGQQLTPQVLRDVDRWIMEQIAPSADGNSAHG